MPATIRIDFDVHSESISESLKKELSQVQVIIASANSVVQASQSARITKVANEAISAEKQVTREAAAAYKQREAEQKAITKAFVDYEKLQAKEAAAAKKALDKEVSDYEKLQEKERLAAIKEREKQEKYLAGVRMKSIADANKAEEKAEKERHAANSKPSHGGGAAHNIVEGAEHGLGFGLAIEGLKVIKEKSEEAAKAQEGFRAGTGLVGKELEKQGKEAEELGHKYAISGELAKGVEGNISAATHQVGEELNVTTEAVIAYASTHRKANQTLEESLNLTQKKAGTEKGLAKIMAESQLNIAKAQEAAQSPAANLARIQNTLSETVGKTAMTVLEALQPALAAVTPILTVVGELVESVVKPAMEALSPVMKLVAETFTQLAPVIVDLINTALSVLMPIISDASEIFRAIIPPLIEIVKTIMTALTPVFKQLMPVIEEVAGIIRDVLVANSDMLIDMLQNVLVPIIRDLVAPILLSLMPVFKLLADMMRDQIVPVTRIMSGVMKFLMENVIQPLIKWLSGGLVSAIQGVVGVITKAIETVKSITNAIGSFLGLGGEEAKAATKENGKKVIEQDKQNEELAKAQKEQQFKDREKATKIHLLNQMKAGKLSGEEEAELREGADEKLLNQLDAYDKKKANQASGAHKKALKEVKDAYTEAKNLEEARFKESEVLLLQKKISEHLTDEQFQKLKEKLELDHITKIKEFSSKFHKDETAATIAYLNLQIDNQKKADAKELDALKLAVDEKKDAAVEFATENNLTDKQQKKALYEIEVQAYKDQIAILTKQHADVTKITLEFGKFQRAHAKEEISENRKDSEEIAKIALETEKARIDAMTDGVSKEKAQLKLSLADETQKEKQELLQAGDNEKLKDAIHQQHEEKRNQISLKYAKEEKARKMEQISFLTGPFIGGFSKATDELNKKFFQPVLNKWINQKTFIGGILSDLTSKIVEFATQWIAQKAIAVAADALFGATETASMAAIAAAAAPAAALTSLASFGANAIPANAAIAATTAAAKLAAGFKEGGFTGYGNENQVAGPVHKNEFVLKSGSFAVDSNGNLVAVAGMHGGNNAPVVEAIQQQTEHLGKQFGESRIINQRRMVLENKVSERSKSRATV